MACAVIYRSGLEGWNSRVFFFCKSCLFLLEKWPLQGGAAEISSIQWFAHQIAATTRAEPIQSRGLLQVSQMGTGTHDFGPSVTACPGCKQGAGWGVEQLEHGLLPMWNVSACR